VGGDFELSELMGYAGDSRLDAAGTSFVATDPDDRGLDPPKIAVEFDTRTNNRIDDPPPDYCAGPNVETNLRNDPLTANKDAVQYVFWGRENFLDIPCRGDSPLYDDNRHDAFGEGPTEEWHFGPAATFSFWRPAIGSNGTIYASDQVDTLYAFNEDGTTKWTFDLSDGNEYMPGVDRTGGPNDGTIYSDIFGSSLIAINPDGSEKWRRNVNSDISSTPTVGPDGTIYFGTRINELSLFALNPDSTVKWQFVTGDEVNTVPALSPDSSAVYAVSNDNFLYAVNTADGTEKWRFPMPTEPDEITSSPTVNPNDGTIYVGSDPDAAGDSYVYALNPAARTADPNPVAPLGTFPQPGEWRFGPVGEVESSAALDPKDGTIYIGSDDRYVYAINPNGTQKWRFRTGGNVESSPIVDVDGTVYIGSLDGNVYALKTAARLADATEQTLDTTAGEWAFSTGGPVPSSPALGQAGFIHIGSDDTNFYTISQFADPRNFKDEDQDLGKLLTSAELDSSVLVNSNTDWLNGAGARGSWAVRLEVDRALLPDADGNFNYDLRLWMRQCLDTDDIPCDKILGTFYQDTRIEYDYTAVQDLPMRQRIRLSGTEQDAFESFFFGFTGAAGAEALDVSISQFQLSFIRPGDPVVTCDDQTKWPRELPLLPCVPDI
jgi:outer membrane protein assembly factor BamB